MQPPARVDEQAPAKPKKKGSFLRELVVLVVSALLIALGVKTFVAQAFYIPSGSMLPQLEIGDRIVVSKLSYRLHDPRRGDIVVFDAPTPQPKSTDTGVQKVVRGFFQAIGLAAPSTDEYVKRVIGLPGEVVEGHDGKVYVNGKPVVEPYLPSGVTTSDFAAITVPAGRLWVMGDNRGNSSDSRVFGPIRESTIVGRAIVRVWPVPNAAFL